MYICVYMYVCVNVFICMYVYICVWHCTLVYFSSKSGTLNPVLNGLYLLMRLELNGAGKAPRGRRSDIFLIHIFSWKLKKIYERKNESGKKYQISKELSGGMIPEENRRTIMNIFDI